jgi:uncharacterized protein YggU (UPF0235/DUF167 family)
MPAVSRLLESALAVAATSVHVVAGPSSARKIVEIKGLSPEELRVRLGDIGGADA